LLWTLWPLLYILNMRWIRNGTLLPTSLQESVQEQYRVWHHFIVLTEKQKSEITTYLVRPECWAEQCTYKIEKCNTDLSFSNVDTAYSTTTTANYAHWLHTINDTNQSPSVVWHCQLGNSKGNLVLVCWWSFDQALHASAVPVVNVATSHISCCSKIHNHLSFWNRLTQVVLKAGH